VPTAQTKRDLEKSDDCDGKDESFHGPKDSPNGAEMLIALANVGTARRVVVTLTQVEGHPGSNGRDQQVRPQPRTPTIATA